MSAVLDLQGIVKGFDDGTLRPTQTRITMAELTKVTALGTNFVSYYDEFKQPWYSDILNAYQAENVFIDPRMAAKRSDAVRLIYDTLMLTGEGT